MFAELLRERLQGIAELTNEQIAALQSHYELMLRWNRALNLTKITGLAEAVERHYVESLFLGSHLPAGNLRIADIGSGAGFPGFPVAVLWPGCEVTLIESHQRKAVFLREASRGFKNVRVLAKRAEDSGDRFDWVISRAVSSEDLAPSLSVLAPAVALLSGADEPSISGDWKWNEPIGVPGGKSRLLRIGRRANSAM